MAERRKAQVDANNRRMRDLRAKEKLSNQFKAAADEERARRIRVRSKTGEGGGGEWEEGGGGRTTGEEEGGGRECELPIRAECRPKRENSCFE